MINEQPKVIKLFYLLKSKLNGEKLDLLNHLWVEKVPKQFLINQKT